MRAKRHVADDRRRPGEINTFAESGLPAQKFVELWVKFGHVEKLADTRGKTMKYVPWKRTIPSRTTLVSSFDILHPLRGDAHHHFHRRG
jgi:hypothetical protein